MLYEEQRYIIENVPLRMGFTLEELRNTFVEALSQSDQVWREVESIENVDIEEGDSSDSTDGSRLPVESLFADIA